MKKALAAVLMIALLASLSAPAFAATNDGTESTNIPVDGIYQAADAPADTVSVDIVWDSMSFTYTAPSKGTWNANGHKYENPVTGGWSATDGVEPKITVTNHSNVDVKADFSFASDVDGMTGSFTEDTLLLETAEGTEVENAPKGETGFSISGGTINQNQELGTITVKVANNAPVRVGDEAALVQAINDNEPSIKLTNNITLSDDLYIMGQYAGTIDLNGKKIAAPSDAYPTIYIATPADTPVIFKNGTMTGGISPVMMISGNSNVILKNCTVETSTAGQQAIEAAGGTVTLTDCKIISRNYNIALMLKSVNVTFGGETEVSGNGTETAIYLNDENVSVTCTQGTYNFDPTAYVDSAKFTVTKNEETGIWTVTAK